MPGSAPGSAAPQFDLALLMQNTILQTLLAGIAVLCLAALRPCGAQQPVALDTGTSFLHKPIVAGDTVHVFSAGSGADLRYNRSTDSGKTWLPAPVVIALNVQLVAAVAEGSSVAVSLQSASGPLLLRSSDGGVSWLPAIPMHPQSPTQSTAMLSLVQGVLIAAWSEPRVGAGEVYVNRSFDLGTTWEPTDTRLDVGLPNVAHRPVQIVGDALALYVAFHDGYGPNTMCYLSKTLDRGATWDIAPRFAGQGDGMRVAAVGAVVLAGIGSQVKRSIDYGMTWTQTPITGHGYPPIAMSGSRAVAATSVGSSAIQVHYSADSGATWVSGQSFPGVAQFWMATLSIDGDTVCAGIISCFSFCCVTCYSYHVSTDGGASWRPWTWYSRLDTGQGLRTATPLQNGLFLAYVNTVDTTYGLVYHGFHAYGPATPGTAGIVPVLERSGTPSPGHGVALSLTNALGGSPALIGVSFAGPANVPIGNATILLAQPVVSTWFVTSGPAGAPGAGTATLPFTIPASSSFAGLHVFLQGLVLDLASATGFAATAGLEMLIR